MRHTDDCLCGCRDFDSEATECPFGWDQTMVFPRKCTRELLHHGNHQQGDKAIHDCSHSRTFIHSNGFTMCVACYTVTGDPGNVAA